MKGTGSINGRSIVDPHRIDGIDRVHRARRRVGLFLSLSPGQSVTLPRKRLDRRSIGRMGGSGIRHSFLIVLVPLRFFTRISIHLRKRIPNLLIVTVVEIDSTPILIVIVIAIHHAFRRKKVSLTLREHARFACTS